METHAEICRAIDAYRDTAITVGHQIHQHPELKFQERFAANLLADAGRKLGLDVQTGVCELETAFRAEFGDPNGPAVAILAEYDALPNGHSCGHNLIASAALTAVAGLKNGVKKLPGRIVFLGTPAEEGGGGKVILLERGALKGVDAAMMAHPADGDACMGTVLAVKGVRFNFHGKAAHAAYAPWNGASALSAVLQTFQSIDAMRLHLRENARPRVHGIITNGGQAVKIVPERTACEFLVRAKTASYCDEIAERVMRCAEGAALATGTRVECEVFMGYKDMVNNRAMAGRYASHSEALGTRSPEASPDAPTASTDMGNVSHAIPSIHPMFGAAPRGTAQPHEDAFVAHADSDYGYAAMIRVAKALAMTAYDLLADPQLMKAAKEEFAARAQG